MFHVSFFHLYFYIYSYMVEVRVILRIFLVKFGSFLIKISPFSYFYIYTKNYPKCNLYEMLPMQDVIYTKCYLYEM